MFAIKILLTLLKIWQNKVGYNLQDLEHIKKLKKKITFKGIDGEYELNLIWGLLKGYMIVEKYFLRETERLTSFSYYCS